MPLLPRGVVCLPCEALYDARHHRLVMRHKVFFPRRSRARNRCRSTDRPLSDLQLERRRATGVESADQAQKRRIRRSKIYAARCARNSSLGRHDEERPSVMSAMVPYPPSFSLSHHAYVSARIDGRADIGGGSRHAIHALGTPSRGSFTSIRILIEAGQWVSSTSVNAPGRVRGPVGHTDRGNCTPRQRGQASATAVYQPKSR